MSRLVVIDDSDTAIDYSVSGWASINGSFPSEVLLDNAIFQTAHVLTSNGSFSYAFNGSSVEVFGVSSELHLPPSHSQDPSWQCFVDNILISNNNSALRGFPWTSYCSQDGLNNNPHTLTMNITASQTQPFWLDYIRYTPLPTDLLADKTILVNSTDSALQFTSLTDWQPLGTAKIVSPLLGADTAGFQFTFNGTGITWYGLSPNSIKIFGDLFNGDRSTTEGIAIAVLDGVSQNFSIPSLVAPNSSDLSYDSIILNYTSLDPTKEHTLNVTYQSPPDTPSPPLSLDFLLVENGPSSVIGNSSTGTAQPPSPPPLNSNGNSKHNSLNVAAVVGGVLGGVLVLLLIFLLIRYRRSQQRARYKSKLRPANNMVFHPDVDDTFTDADTYAMRDSTLRNSGSVRAFSPPKRETFSKRPEEMPILEEQVFSPNRVSSPVPERLQEFPNHRPQPSTSTSVPPSTRTSGMLIDFPETRWSTASPASSSPSNPFRRLNLANPIPSQNVIASLDNPSRETVVPPRSLSRSNTNPFRGGPLTPTSTGRP